MDTGEYDTNVLSINNISSVVFRVYEPTPDQAHTFSSAAIEIESSLREDGYLVLYDAIRRGLWHFRLQEKDSTAETVLHELDTVLTTCGVTLTLAEEGKLEPASLQKGRHQAPTVNNTPPSSASTTSGPDPSQRGLQALPTNSQEQDAKGAIVAGSEVKSAQSQNKIAYENFILAALLALTAALSFATGATPLNYRTILFPPESTGRQDTEDASLDQVAYLGTFGAYLTTNGAFIVSFKVSQCKGIMSLDNLLGASITTPGQRILTAPFGLQACQTYGGDFGTASLAQTPNTQALSFRGISDGNDGFWKQACLKVLRFRGIAQSALEDCPWIHVPISRRRFQDNNRSEPRRTRDGVTMISWPRSLCFRQKIVDMPLTSQVGDNFLSGHEESHDPLGTAGRWLNNTNDRDEQLSRRKADRAAAAAMEVDGGIRAPLAPEGSLALGRPNAAAAGAMYPTPPDAIQQPNGITPTFDGGASSPQNIPSVPAVDADEPEQNNGDVHHSDGELWHRPEPRRERSDSNALGDGENDLMAGDMFGGDDITEADFNFFDEEPDDMDLSMPDFDASDIAPRKQQLPPPQQQQPQQEQQQQPQLPPPPPPSNKLDEPRVKSETPAAKPPFQDAHVFTKPELKHARSFMNEDQALRMPNDASTSVSKHVHSPFNQETVFRQVRASLSTPPKDHAGGQPGVKRKASIFEKVELGASLPMMNKKYEKGGQFNFEQKPSQEKSATQKGLVPEMDFLKRHGKRNRKHKEQGLPPSALRRFTALEAPSSHPSPFRTVGSLSDDDQSSVESDQDDSSYTSEEPGSPTKSSVKRPPLDDENASQVTSLKDFDTLEEPDHQFALELPRLSRPEPPEVALSKLFLDPEPLSLEQTLGDDDLVNIAQLITEQAATGKLIILDTLKDESSVFTMGTIRQELTSKARDSIAALQDVIPKSLSGASQSRLRPLLEIQDVPLQGQPSRLQPRPVPGRDQNPDQLRANNLYQIPCHHVEVRRAETRMSLLPSAVSFWESLGLAPTSGSKDVSSVCVFPGWEGMADNVKTFLERAKSVYELSRLGTFERLSLPDDLEAGLLPYELDRISTSPDASVTGHGSALIESMEILQSALSSTTLQQTNFVVYMVYSPNNPGTIIEACLAFQRFFESYWKQLASRRETIQNELVLQLVSADLISSPTSMVVTQATDLMKLCMETYDRCTLFEGPMPAPAVVLEYTLPRPIEFKLTTNPSASLMHENSCIHLAYAQSVDERWVSAAWTDDRGSYQTTASYCLGRKGRPLSTPLQEVCHEMWQSTLEIASVRKIHWRIIITKSGPMDAEELESWAELARTESSANVSLILMTVDTDPALQLIPPPIQLPPAAPGFYSTPVSTPQANIVSPEQSAAPATPIRETGSTAAATPGAETTGDSENDAALLDLTDQTWGAVLAHRLNNSTSQLEMQPALVSGYLIKRTGVRLEDPPAIMEVNLVHTEPAVRVYEPLLREMMSYFRALGTLARARGVVDRDADVRPWHIAAAEKVVRALYMLL